MFDTKCGCVCENSGTFVENTDENFDISLTLYRDYVKFRTSQKIYINVTRC